jgi:hypothetical protein
MTVSVSNMRKLVLITSMHTFYIVKFAEFRLLHFRSNLKDGLQKTYKYKFLDSA